MKKPLIILLLISCLCLAGCSKDAQANSFMKEYAAMTRAVADKLAAGDVQGARAAFEEKKQSLDAKWDKIRTGLPFQFSAETKKRMKTAPEENMTELAEAANAAIRKNPKDEARIQALVLDIANVFRK